LTLLNSQAKVAHFEKANIAHHIIFLGRPSPVGRASRRSDMAGGREREREKKKKKKKKKKKGIESLPPFLECDVAIAVHVYFVKKARQSAQRYGNPSPLKGSSKLIHAQFAIVVPVNGLEHDHELPLGSLDEDAKFYQELQC
jgi:hypothetical protein